MITSAIRGSTISIPTAPAGAAQDVVALLEQTAGQPAAAGGDELTLSPQAELLADSPQTSVASLLAGLELPTPENQHRAQSVVQAKLSHLFSDNGIDSSHEIQLQVAGDGRVIVANDHPQKAQIEEFFAEDPELRDDFAKFSCLTSTLAAFQEGVAFQKAYARDPYAAVAQYSYLFSGARTETTLSIQDGEYRALWQRAGSNPIEVWEDSIGP